MELPALLIIDMVKDNFKEEKKLPITPFAKKITKEPPRKAVSDRLVGKQGIVIEDVLPDTGGVVKVEGDVWRAVSPKMIEKGGKIIVKKVESVKLHVESIDEQTTNEEI